MKLFESQMRFCMFTGTYHKPGKHPTVSIRQDIEIIQQLDRLGFDEVWVGEHHSSGVSPCPSPELLLAGAAERTERIKLGTGVVSSPITTRSWWPIASRSCRTSRRGGRCWASAPARCCATRR